MQARAYLPASNDEREYGGCFIGLEFYQPEEKMFKKIKKKKMQK